MEKIRNYLENVSICVNQSRYSVVSLSVLYVSVRLRRGLLIKLLWELIYNGNLYGIGEDEYGFC